MSRHQAYRGDENRRDAAGAWDALVIGSGLGGLTTAAYLATNGLRTMVLEQHAVPGGYCRAFRRDGGYEFDIGVHYIPDCDPGGSLPTVLRGLGLQERIEFLEMDPDGFDTLIFPDCTLRVPRGWDRFTKRLIDLFPDEEKALRKCLGILRALGGQIEPLSEIPSSVPGLLSLAVKKPTVARWALRSTEALFDACGLSVRARAVMSGQWGLCLVPPDQMPVGLYAAFLHNFIEGGSYYPKGGCQVLPASLIEVIEAHGGRVRTSATAKEILVDRGRVTGVRLEGEERLAAPVVVAACDLKRTYQKLLDVEHVSARTLKRIERYRMAMSIFVVYLGVNIDLRGKLPNTNYWYHPTDDGPAAQHRLIAGLVDQGPEARREALRRMPIYLSSSSLRDPTNTRAAPPGQTNIQLMTGIPGDHRLWGVDGGPEEWGDYVANPQYRAVAEDVADALIDTAARIVPDLRSHIVFKEVATPITHEDLTLSGGGSAYGIEVSTRQVGPWRPGATTEIDGLYLAGASTVWGHASVGVTAGAVGAASAVLGRDLFEELHAGRSYGDPSKLAHRDFDWDPFEPSGH